MTDLATLALKVDSSDVPVGVDRLDKLTDAGAKAEGSTKRVTTATERFGQALALLGITSVVAGLTNLARQASAFQDAMAEVSTQEQLDHIRKGWRDRYGKLPEAVENLLATNELRLVASARKITGVEVRDSKVMLIRNGDYVLINGKFPRVSESAGSARLSELVKLVRSF